MAPTNSLNISSIVPSIPTDFQRFSRIYLSKDNSNAPSFFVCSYIAISSDNIFEYSVPSNPLITSSTVFVSHNSLNLLSGIVPSGIINFDVSSAPNPIYLVLKRILIF